MTHVIGYNYYEDFKKYDTNSDGHLSEDEMLVYRNERFKAFGQGNVDDTEQKYIKELIKALRKDGVLDQTDFLLVADTISFAERKMIGRTKGGSLPENMNPTMSWTGNPAVDMPLNRQISLETAEDYLKFCLQGKNVSDNEKLYLFNRMKDLNASDGTVNSTAVSNMCHAYIPVFATQNVFDHDQQNGGSGGGGSGGSEGATHSVEHRLKQMKKDKNYQNLDSNEKTEAERRMRAEGDNGGVTDKEYNNVFSSYIIPKSKS